MPGIFAIRQSPFANRQKQMASGGFTLIELLVVFGLLSIATTVVLLFLTTFLKGANQANVTAEVKQNGQIVIDSLDRQIRNAIDVQGDPSAVDYIRLKRESPFKPLHIRCFNDENDPNKGLNGWIGVVESDLTDPSFTGKNITNTDLIAGIDIVDCTLEIIELDASKPKIVRISFTVNQGISAPSRADYKANAYFETTVSLRQY